MTYASLSRGLWVLPLCLLLYWPAGAVETGDHHKVGNASDTGSRGIFSYCCTPNKMYDSGACLVQSPTRSAELSS